jgi:hypothetical protein
MLRRVAPVRTDVSEELSASIIRVTRIGELGTLAVTSNRRTLWRNTLLMEVLSSSETSVITRATRRNIPEDDILPCHCREYLKTYIALTGWTLQWRRNVSPVKYELGFYIPEDCVLHYFLGWRTVMWYSLQIGSGFDTVWQEVEIKWKCSRLYHSSHHWGSMFQDLSQLTPLGIYVPGSITAHTLGIYVPGSITAHTLGIYVPGSITAHTTGDLIPSQLLRLRVTGD